MRPKLHLCLSGWLLCTSFAAAQLCCSPALADVYPVTGVWVTQDSNFPVGSYEACFAIRLSGLAAVNRNSIAEMMIFNGEYRWCAGLIRSRPERARERNGSVTSLSSSW